VTRSREARLIYFKHACPLHFRRSAPRRFGERAAATLKPPSHVAAGSLLCAIDYKRILVSTRVGKKSGFEMAVAPLLSHSIARNETRFLARSTFRKRHRHSHLSPIPEQESSPPGDRSISSSFFTSRAAEAAIKVATLMEQTGDTKLRRIKAQRNTTPLTEFPCSARLQYYDDPQRDRQRDTFVIFISGVFLLARGNSDTVTVIQYRTEGTLQFLSTLHFPSLRATLFLPPPPSPLPFAKMLAR